MSKINKCNLPIGFFDSGLGGVSVLREAAKMLTQESFLFYGDSGRAPYGTKGKEEIKKYTLDAADFLVEKGIKSLVVACNTATSVAIKDLRKRYNIPVIGMEPALKPAVELNRPGKIIVMATPLTLREEKFKCLLQKHAHRGNILPLSCPGLVELIEKDAGSEKIREYLGRLFVGLSEEQVGCIVLGCTHYVFIRTEVSSCFPAAVVLDGNKGTVHHLQNILTNGDLLSTTSPAERRVEFYTSGAASYFLPLYQHFFELLQN